jgi:membrane protein implicated in regulation of membrane protease activity
MGIFNLMFQSNYLPIIWIGIAVGFVLIEAATMGLTTIWFAIGAAVTAIAVLLDAGPRTQIVIFLAVSVLMMIFTRPVAIRRLRLGREKNVTEQMAGRSGVVTKAVDSFGAGRVKVGGVSWAAVAEDPALEIEKGAVVAVIRIEGVKLVVRPVGQNA